MRRFQRSLLSLPRPLTSARALTPIRSNVLQATPRCHSGPSIPLPLCRTERQGPLPRTRTEPLSSSHLCARRCFSVHNSAANTRMSGGSSPAPGQEAESSQRAGNSSTPPAYTSASRGSAFARDTDVSGQRNQPRHPPRRVVLREEATQANTKPFPLPSQHVASGQLNPKAASWAPQTPPRRQSKKSFLFAPKQSGAFAYLEDGEAPSSSPAQRRDADVRRGRQERSTPPPGRPPKAGRAAALPGGDLAHARGVSALSADPNAAHRVMTMLRSDQRRANPGCVLDTPEPEELNVPHTTLKRCVMRLSVPGVAEEVLAIGQSSKTKLARTLCYMHAEELLDFLSSGEAAEAKDQATWPPPLVEKKLSDAVPAPRERDYATWDAYVDASDQYARATAARAQREVFEQERVPLSGHPVADRAAELLRRHRRLVHTDAVGKLNESLRDGSQLIKTTNVVPRVFVATLTLDAKSGLTATGVAKNSKDARRECAAHALCILELLRRDAEGLPQDAPLQLEKGNAGEAGSKGAQQQQQREKQKGKRGRRGGGEEEEEGDDSAPAATLDAVLQQLQPAHGKLVRFFNLLFGNDELAPEMTFTREKSPNGSLLYHCQLTMGDITCCGKGVNRFEAERSAMEGGVTELLLYDDRLQALQKFVDAYPSIAPESVPSAALPRKLVTELAAQLHPVAQRQRAMAAAREAASSASAAASGDGGDGAAADRRLNAEERALLQLTERAFSDDPVYSARMLNDLRAVRRHPTYLETFHTRRSTLAMAAVRERLLQAVQQHRVTVVCGTTGCGKTTQVPQYILDHEIEAGRGGSCNILVTQPRRLSSFSVADRIASERLSTVGKDVGYAVRLDARPGRHITICTTGVLLQIFSTHPELEHVSHLIIDEVHERDINCDVVLALVKELLARNPRLRVVLMSATMQSDMFAKYFGDDTPVIEVDGAVYPVSVRYLEDVAVDAAASHFYSPAFDVVPLQNDRAGGAAPPSPRSLLRRPPKTDYNLIAYLVHRAVQVDLHGNTTGKSLLVFLPGWKELVSAKSAIEQYNGPHTIAGSGLRFHIILLHSTVDSAKQRECFVPAPPGTVKVVLATNIAESGITIDDAAVVIDTGLIKTTTWASRPTSTSSTGAAGWRASPSSLYVPLDELSQRQDASAGSGGATAAATPSPVFSTQLMLGYASQANGTQRKGRAGRTQGGVCYRLYTKALWEALPAFPEADIHRVPLTQVLLKLLSLGYARPKETLQTFLEPPSPTNAEVSMNLLRGIGAVNEVEQLTPLGEYLAKLPCDPRIGKMIIMGAVLRCLDSVLTVAACADVSPFVTSREQSAAARKKRYLFSRGSQSDHISYLNAYNAYCANGEKDGFASFNALHQGNLRIISRYKAQYRDILQHTGLLTDSSAAAEGGMVGAAEDDDDVLLNDGEEAEALADHEPTTATAAGAASDAAASALPSPRYPGELCVDTSSLSANSFDVALVKACVCAALFPNVALLRPPPNKGSALQRRRAAAKVELRTRHFTSIKPSKESACRRVGGPREHDVPSREELLEELEDRAREREGDAAGSGAAGAPAKAVPALFYVYQDVFGVKEARQEFLTTLSSVSLWALLLFGASESTTQYYPALSLCVVDGWIALHIDHDTYQLLTELRQALYACLHRKYHHPRDEQNNAALRTVTELCRAVLKAPVLGHTNGSTELESGDHGGLPASQLVDSGSITDPLVLVRPTLEGSTDAAGGVGVDGELAGESDDTLADSDLDDEESEEHAVF